MKPAKSDNFVSVSGSSSRLGSRTQVNGNRQRIQKHQGARKLEKLKYMVPSTEAVPNVPHTNPYIVAFLLQAAW